MRVWLTKYALTKGIFEAEAELCEGTASMICLNDIYKTCYHGEGKDWHRSPVAAHTRAERMRLDKIKSLRGQIAKLERMRFVPPDREN